MIGLDTNILVRYLIRDDVEQTRIADSIVEGSEDAGKPVFVNHIVLSELVWVMTKSYRLNRIAIAEALEGIFSAQAFLFEERDIALGALRDFRNGSADYADCLIGRKNREMGCETTLSFDAGAVSLDYFRSA